MVLDTSAIVSILFREVGYERLQEKVFAAETVLVGTPTLVETAMIVKRDADDRVDLAAFMNAAEIELVSFDERHYRSAISAFARFGKGRHSARLNILDCMSYAVADVERLPLLWVGDDFSKTDIEAA